MMFWYYLLIAVVVVGVIAEHYKTQIIKFFASLKVERVARPTKPKRTTSTNAMWTHFEEMKEMYVAKTKKETPKKVEPKEQVWVNSRGETIRRKTRSGSKSALEAILKHHAEMNRATPKPTEDTTKKTRTVLKEKIPKF